MMQETIAPPINDALGRISNAKELVFRQKANGKFYVTWGDTLTDMPPLIPKLTVDDDDDALTDDQCDDVDENVNTGDMDVVDDNAESLDTDLVKARIPITLFGTGDNAYISMCLGREGRSGIWCNRCEWSNTQWKDLKDDDDKTGPLWTVESMKAARVKIEGVCPHHYKRGPKKGQAKPWSSADKKGMIAHVLPLFWHIPVQNWLVPLLHTIDLFANTWINIIFQYIDYRLEDRPYELMEARQDCFDNGIAKDEASATLETSKTTIEILQAEVASLVPAAGTKVKDFDDRAHYDEWVSAKQTLTEAKKVKAKHQAVYDEAKSAQVEAATKVSKLEDQKEYGALTQGLRQDVEEMLQEVYFIMRSSYHGGDMEGNYCRKFMAAADDVMDDILGKLVEFTTTVSEEEIRHYGGAFKRMLQYFNLLSYYAYHSWGELTDAQLDNVDILVLRMDRLWQKMTTSRPPKEHLWFHLAVDLRRTRGMKNHHESKAETAHQDGSVANEMARGSAGVKQRIEVGLKYTATKEDPAVQQTQEEVHKARERNFKDKVERRARKAEAKGVKRASIEDILREPEIEGTFLSLLEMGKLDRQREIDDETADVDLAVDDFTGRVV